MLSAIKDCDVLPVADVDNAEALKHPALSAIKRHPAKRVALAVMGDFLFGSLGSIVTAQREFGLPPETHLPVVRSLKEAREITVS